MTHKKKSVKRQAGPTSEELFNRLPDVFFQSNLKMLLLLQTPSEKAEAWLKPILERYEEIEPMLSGGEREKLHDVLRIFPELAGKYGIDVWALPKENNSAEPPAPEETGKGGRKALYPSPKKL